MAVISKVYIFHLFREQIWEIRTQSLANGVMNTTYREKGKRMEQKDLLRRAQACNSEVIVNLENVKEAPSLTMQKDYVNRGKVSILSTYVCKNIVYLLSQRAGCKFFFFGLNLSSKSG